VPKAESFTQRGNLTFCGGCGRVGYLPLPRLLQAAQESRLTFSGMGEARKQADTALSALPTLPHICPPDTQALVEKSFKVTLGPGDGSCGQRVQYSYGPATSPVC